MSAPAALAFTDVSLVRGGEPVLRGLTWTVAQGERWMVLGPNGSGKTSIVQLATGYLHPTSGTVDILGHRLGRVDVRWLRPRLGLASGAVTRLLRPDLTAAEVVMTAKHAALEPWWHEYTEDDRAKAVALLDGAGLGPAADRRFGVLSEGERQQVLVARTLMADPELVVLDEPAAGLDLGARERLVSRLHDLAVDPATPPMVFVTHHVEEIPPGFTHALLLRQGRVVATGPLADTITSEALSACFDVDVSIDRRNDRFTARAVGPKPRS